MRDTLLNILLTCAVILAIIGVGGMLIFLTKFVILAWQALAENPDCPGCHVEPNTPHRYNCDVALCLNTESPIDQLRHLCKFRHNHGYDEWTGENPGAVDATDLAKRHMLITDGKGKRHSDAT